LCVYEDGARLKQQAGLIDCDKEGRRHVLWSETQVLVKLGEAA